MTTRVRTTMFALLGVALCGCPTAQDRTAGRSVVRRACDSDADCKSGQECEREHGERFCKPHGGNRGHDDRVIGAAADADDDTDASTVACRVDADCDRGEECEREHGTARCEPRDNDAGIADEHERDHDDDRGRGGDDNGGHGGDDNRGRGDDDNRGRGGDDNRGHGDDDDRGHGGDDNRGHGGDDNRR